MENFKLILSMAGTLVLMLAVFAGAYYVSRLVGKGYPGGAAAHSQIEITAKRAIGKNQSLLIVKAAGQAFLIGTADKSISVIGELNADNLPDAPPAPQQPGIGFCSVLQEALHRRKTGQPEGEDRE